MVRRRSGKRRGRRKQTKIKCWQIYWKRKSSIHKMAPNTLTAWRLFFSMKKDYPIRVRAQHPNAKMRNSFIHISPCPCLCLSLALSILFVTFDFNSEIYLFIWLTEFAHTHRHTHTHTAFMFISFNLIYADIHSRIQLNE